VGLIAALVVGSAFEGFYENFLLALSYWITPWLGIVLVDYFVTRRTTVARIEQSSPLDRGALGVYLVSILVSVPFMVPLVTQLDFFPVGSLSYLFGGADFSYFVSFAVACVMTYALRSWRRR